MWTPWKKKTSEVRVVKRISRQPSISMRSFYAGVVDRLTSRFTGSELSINESLKLNLDTMRHRSRELWNDNDYGKKFIGMVKTNVIGAKGIRLQARSLGSNKKPDKIDNDAIERSWKDWSKMQHASCNKRLSLLDIQRIAISAVAAEGECFVRIVKRSNYKYGVALQLIEADMFDTQFNVERLDNGNKIIMSVELDEFNAPIAYYVLTKHPSETTYSYSGKTYQRLPAEEIIHLFLPERINQARGIPWMHASIRRINMIGGYEEAELVASRAGASKMGFYYSDDGEGYKGDDVTADGELIEEVEPGSLKQLPNNVKFESYDPQHPTGAFNYFMRGVLKGAAAGLGVSYTGFSGDLEAVNYSSIRAGLIDERENWRVVQGWVVEHMMGRIYEAWLSGALTRGLIVNDAGVKLPLSKKEKYLNVAWQTRGWAWVDPLKDEQANVLAVSKGHMTNTEVAAQRGLDLEDVYERLAYEKELAESYGLTFTPPEVSTDEEQEQDATA